MASRTRLTAKQLLDRSTSSSLATLYDQSLEDVPKQKVTARMLLERKMVAESESTAIDKKVPKQKVTSRQLLSSLEQTNLRSAVCDPSAVKEQSLMKKVGISFDETRNAEEVEPIVSVQEPLKFGQPVRTKMTARQLIHAANLSERKEYVSNVTDIPNAISESRENDANEAPELKKENSWISDEVEISGSPCSSYTAEEQDRAHFEIIEVSTSDNEFVNDSVEEKVQVAQLPVLVSDEAVISEPIISKQIQPKLTPPLTLVNPFPLGNSKQFEDPMIPGTVIVVNKKRLDSKTAEIKVANVVTNWFRDFNQNHVIKSIESYVADSISYTLCNSLIEEGMRSNGVAVAHTARLLLNLAESKLVLPRDIKATLANLAENWLTRGQSKQPHAYRHFGIIYGTMMIYDSWLFSLRSLHEMLKVLIASDATTQDFVKTPLILAQALDVIQAVKGEIALVEFMKFQDFDISMFWKKKMYNMDLDDWFEENGLDCLLQ
ncbi:hypothetical protein BC830DRAFT_1120412 [Chytriomyces sp. MP71]|nr:hypothetical protein BC830DRAFT_1120412 [Chytriomyces sp. MP71]